MERFSHLNRDRAEGFGALADIYERTRPEYPSELIDRLTAGGAGLVIDVGTGTGRVADALRAAGWTVVGVDPDGRMAAVARRKGHRVEIARFEEWSPALEGADLLGRCVQLGRADASLAERHRAELAESGHFEAVETTLITAVTPTSGR